MFDTKIKRACVYTRVSTDAQAEKEVSLQEQERMAKAAIVSKGWEYTETFEDAGFTGRNMDRPALQSMIAKIQAGEVDAVVIFKLDRLSRKQKDALTIIEDIMLENDVELVSLKETLDTSTPWGRAMIGILASFNQLESETIVQRTSVGRTAKARKGGYAGGKPPLGYKAVEGELVIVPEEAEIVRLVFSLRKENYSMMAIADELNNRGYRTKKGGAFRHSAIQTILNNKQTYKGTYKYGTEESTVGQHEAILTED